MSNQEPIEIKITTDRREFKEDEFKILVEIFCEHLKIKSIDYQPILKKFKERYQDGENFKFIQIPEKNTVLIACLNKDITGEEFVIYEDSGITKKEFLNKYLPILEDLPSNLSVFTAYPGDTAAREDIERINHLSIFSEEMVRKFGKENLLTYSPAYLIKQLKNGSILVWIDQAVKPAEEDTMFLSRAIENCKDTDVVNFRKYLKKIVEKAK